MNAEDEMMSEEEYNQMLAWEAEQEKKNAGEIIVLKDGHPQQTWIMWLLTKISLGLLCTAILKNYEIGLDLLLKSLNPGMSI
jgi:hypothetical protein